MELAFRLIAELRGEAIGEIVKPPEERQSEFHYGRVHGILYGLGVLEERLKDALEADTEQRQRREREFDAV